jgi:hypothetical protein
MFSFNEHSFDSSRIFHFYILTAQIILELLSQYFSISCHWYYFVLQHTNQRCVCVVMNYCLNNYETLVLIYQYRCHIPRNRNFGTYTPNYTASVPEDRDLNTHRLKNLKILSTKLSEKKSANGSLKEQRSIHKFTVISFLQDEEFHRCIWIIQKVFKQTTDVSLIHT